MKKILLALALVLGGCVGFLTLPTPVWADEVAPMVQADKHALVLTPVVWTVITGLILPFVVGFVTKLSASSAFKAILGIVLAALAAIVERATQADGTAIISGGLLLDIILVYGPQLLSYLGLWSKLNLNAKLAPNFGVG